MTRKKATRKKKRGQVLKRDGNERKLRGNATDVRSSQAGSRGRRLLPIGKHKEMGGSERKQRYLTAIPLASIFSLLLSLDCRTEINFNQKGVFICSSWNLIKVLPP